MDRSALRPRIFAVRCYFACACNTAGAYAMMRAEDPSIEIPNPYASIPRWARNFNERGTVEDAHPPGRPRAIPAEWAQWAAELFKRGYIHADTARGEYYDWSEACDREPAFQMIADIYHVKKATLWGAMAPFLADLVRVQQETFGKANECCAWVHACICECSLQVHTCIPQLDVAVVQAQHAHAARARARIVSRVNLMLLRDGD